jgi:CRP/FNR family transcriptional regulator
LVISGEVKVGRLVGRGREIVTNVFRADCVFGESALIEDYRSGIATALENTRLMVWTTEQIEAVGRENPRLLTALLQNMVERLGNFEERLQSFTVDDARRRLLRAMIEFSKGASAETPASPVWVPPLTHELLASYIGTSREVVTQLMNLFRKQGLLDYSRKGILVYRYRLQEILDEDKDVASAPATAQTARLRYEKARTA